MFNDEIDITSQSICSTQKSPLFLCNINCIQFQNAFHRIAAAIKIAWWRAKFPLCSIQFMFTRLFVCLLLCCIHYFSWNWRKHILQLLYVFTAQIFSLSSWEDSVCIFSAFLLSALHSERCIVAMDFNVHKIQFWFFFCFFSRPIIRKPFYLSFFILRISIPLLAYHFKFGYMCTLAQKTAQWEWI